jgi:molybdopterin-synthase adenylyltransferase
MAGPQGRYSRQERFGPIGRAGQERIRAARVLVTGCGGLGSNAANLLARAGVGLLRIVDRDVVELSNLQRQSLFVESDARDEIPKAVAAARSVAAINSEVKVEPVVRDVYGGNILALMDGIDLVVDGFDNFEGRYVLNDACVKHGVPWVYGACIAASAMAQLVVPGKTACLRCMHRELPARGAAETCETAGIVGPAATIAASLQVSMALRFLVEGAPPAEPLLLFAETWDLEVQRIVLPPRSESCPCCGLRNFEYLDADARASTKLCGDAVQVRPLSAARPNFAALADRLAPLGKVNVSEYLLRLRSPPYELTLFEDGRAIVKGTTDETLARSLLARWIGA